MEEFIAGLDIGTTKICAAAGEAGPAGELNITGVGTAPSRGLRKGMIVDLDSAVGSIMEAVEAAERESGKQITRLTAGISGEHIRGITADGIALIADGRVKNSDIDSAIDNAEKMFVPEGREIIHAIPACYRIDEQREIKHPVGMHARHLEVNVHFITAAVNPYENFCSCIKNAGFELENLVFQPLASMYSVLSEDEKEMGAVLLDVGGGTTDIVIVEEGAVRFSKVIPLGGESVTNDVSVCLQISQKAAEKIKLEYGRAIADGCENKKITFPGREKPVTLKFIAEIIEARVEEIFEFAGREFQQFRGASAPCGMVLTGGGALLPGLADKAGIFFNMPAREGSPVHNCSGLEKYGISPVYSTAAGLAGLCLLERRKRDGDIFSGPGMFGSINRKMRTWFRDFL